MEKRKRATPTKTRAADDGELPPRRNLKFHERSQSIVDEAMELFAEKGFGASLQELAGRVGVTQPLLHRYFPTKADLIHHCKEEIMRGHWRHEWRGILADRRRPLAQRLQAFYAEYLPRIYRRVWYRNFLFAAIDDPKFARDYLNKVTNELLVVVLAELRFESDFPAPSVLPFHERELELVWGMHSTFAFLGMRTMIYGFPMPHDLPQMVRDQVSSYLTAARRLLRELPVPAASSSEASPSELRKSPRRLRLATPR